MLRWFGRAPPFGYRATERQCSVDFVDHLAAQSDSPSADRPAPDVSRGPECRALATLFTLHSSAPANGGLGEHSTETKRLPP
jgi:hypothetical protein